MRHLQPPLHVFVTLATLLPAAALLIGCDQPVKMEPYRPPAVEILMPVGDVDDLADGREFDRLVRLFAPGREPSNEACLRYAMYRYQGRDPRQSGDTATAVVTVKDAKTGNQVGEVKWTMKKVNGFWKLTDAPLPK
jgi:hypothetical protein